MLIIVALIWGANSVASRLAAGEIGPMMLTWMRWAFCIVVLVLLTVSRRQTWRAVMRRWRYCAIMGVLGLTVFNALSYVSGHFTQAVNISVLQGASALM